MEEILGRKKNIHPEILLTSNTYDENLLDNTTFHEEEMENDMLSIQMETTTNEPAVIHAKPTSKPTKSRIFKQKQSTMEKIRLDRKAYFDRRLELECQKIELLKERNKILEEKNRILKENNMSNSLL